MRSLVNLAGQEAASPVLIKAFTSEGVIRSELTDAEIDALVSTGKVVILKSAFDPQR